MFPCSEQPYLRCWLRPFSLLLYKRSDQPPHFRAMLARIRIQVFSGSEVFQTDSLPSAAFQTGLLQTAFTATPTATTAFFSRILCQTTTRFGMNNLTLKKHQLSLHAQW
jgi:hypothetical protein